MDRLRKRLEECRLKVREFVKYNWHNEPEGDKFRSLDILLIAGAVRYKPVWKWQRICWNAYCIVTTCSYSFMVIKAVDEIPGKWDLTNTLWHAAIVLSATSNFVKGSILNRNFESIQTTRNFINSKPFASGDTVVPMSNDSACRKKCFQRLQFAALALFSIILIDQIIFNVPMFKVAEFFGPSRLLQNLAPKLADGIYRLFLLTLSPLWISKYCAGTGVICSLLSGLCTEYKIFVRGFDNILDNVYWDVEEQFPSTVRASPEWKRFHRDQLYWKFLKKHVNNQLKLHIQFAENLQLLAPVVKNLFGTIYYISIVFFSPIIYVMVTNGLSGASIMLLSSVVIQLLECYMWCRIIDSFKDSNEKLELKILDLTSKIPHSQFHRKKYVERQTTLCIMKTFVRNHEPFSCFGVFPISVEAFTELLHIGYTVLTFLRDMGKKNVTTRRRIKQRKLKH